MRQDYLHKQTTITQRTSIISSVVIRPEREIDNSNHVSTCINVPRQLSTVSQIYLLHESEYYPQERVPAICSEASRPFILTTIEDEQTSGEKKRFPIKSQVYQSSNEKTYKLNKKTRRILFLIEPILGGLILFPIIVLFWQCGWNLISIFLNHLNTYNSTFYYGNH